MYKNCKHELFKDGGSVYHYSNFSFFPSASDTTINHLVFTYMRFIYFYKLMINILNYQEYKILSFYTKTVCQIFYKNALHQKKCKKNFLNFYRN